MFMRTFMTLCEYGNSQMQNAVCHIISHHLTRWRFCCGKPETLSAVIQTRWGFTRMAAHTQTCARTSGNVSVKPEQTRKCCVCMWLLSNNTH